MAAERRFRAMGSDAHVIVVGGHPRLVDVAQQRVNDLEGRWSRFIEGSEVSRMNRGAGRFVAVSQDTRTLVERAIDAWRLSGGAFDPTLLGAILRAGYDRSFEELGGVRPPHASWLGAGAEDITLSKTAVRLPAGTGFDPGGIGKGLAADFVSAELLTQGAEGVCVNLGGDIRVRGTSPSEDGVWTVAIEHPWSEQPLALIGLSEGAVATSTTLRRRWQQEGSVRHHLIDPQSGLPSDTDVGLGSVICGDAWVAEVLAKAVVLAGAAHPFDILGGTAAEAIAVALDGTVMASAGLSAYLGGRALPRRVVDPELPGTLP